MPEGLDDAWARAHGREFLLNVGEVFLGEELGMDGRTELVRDARGEQKLQRCADFSLRPLRSGDPLVALVERGLDVEADPVDQRQERAQFLRIGARGVQTDPEAE